MEQSENRRSTRRTQCMKQPAEKSNEITKARSRREHESYFVRMENETPVDRQQCLENMQNRHMENRDNETL